MHFTRTFDDLFAFFVRDFTEHEIISQILSKKEAAHMNISCSIIVVLSLSIIVGEF